MSFWSPDNLQRITAGQWVNLPTRPITGVSIDTRTLQPGQAYLAIVGENYDGHAFVDQAFERGASCAIISHNPPPPGRGAAQRRGGGTADDALLQVTDTVTALQQLASAYRDELARGGCKVISITGSNGKTTTRHILHHVLTCCGLKGTQSPKSFNNHLGVPLTLLAAQPDHHFVACEIGTNHPGEIAALATIAQPDAAIITSIGEEHLEFFKDVNGVAKEEAAILPAVKANGLIVTTAQAAGLLLNPSPAGGGGPRFAGRGGGTADAIIETAAVSRGSPTPPARSGQAPPPMGGELREGVALLPIKDDPSIPAGLPGAGLPGAGLPGVHNRMNAALVLAMARWLGCDEVKAREALLTATTPHGRLRVLRYGEVTVIDDSYNANPDSMRAALDVLQSFTISSGGTSGGGGRRVAVLGEMRELGDASPDAHQRVRQWAASVADHVVFVGKGFDAPALDQGFCNRIADALRPGDVVLLKGSRGVALERILPAIETRFGQIERGGAASRREG